MAGQSPLSPSEQVPSPQAPDVLDEHQYLRERTAPRFGDPLYLHLSDLLIALRSALPPAGSRVLDFGAGGSPYRALFAGSTYHRADLPGPAGLDYIIGEDSRVDSPAAAYDCILSTQVLEHVRDPAAYLQEARRLLRTGGHIVLTTHGLFPDHACPHDYQRWTADGLRLAAQRAGFEVDRVDKVTVNARALVLFNEMFTDRLLPRGRDPVRLLIRASRLLYTRMNRARIHRVCDEDFADCRVVPSDRPWHEFYVALLLVARVA